MTMDNDPQAAHRRRRRRRRQAAVGAISLAAALGATVCVISTHSDSSGVTAMNGSIPPTTFAASSAPTLMSAPPAVGTSPPSSAAGESSPVEPATTPAKASRATAVPAKPDNSEIRKQIDDARSAAAKDGVTLQRALKVDGDVAPVGLSTRTEVSKQGTMRITTARSDLTGQQDQVMAADDGTAAGGARCTRTLRFSQGAKPRTFPNVLLCWRTSAKRSVVTLAVSRGDAPAIDSSVTTINREWTRLG